jgi:DNA replication and repair protein RecF
VQLRHLWLNDFRNYHAGELTPAPDGLTVVQGSNGEGKTNLLEAIGYLATLGSFRGAPAEALVRVGAGMAVIRAEGDREGRALLIETVIQPSGRDRVLVNRQPLRRSRDLLGSLRVSVFAPDDLSLVKGGPAERRRFLDETLVALHPKNDALRSDLDRILRQRNTLLKQAAGRPSPAVLATLDVWDAKLAEVGEALATARAALVERLQPTVSKAYDQVAATAAEVQVEYGRSWPGTLADALAGARHDDLRRAVSTVGPHRDDLALSLGGMPARTHASQGEQRSLALAMRLAAHGVVGEEVGSPPLLLLDDVFSELDPDRSEALLAHLPPGQAFLTTAGPVPAGARPSLVVHVHDGRIGAA